MTKYVIFTDIHLYGGHSLDIDPTGGDVPKGAVRVYLGDNVEINNCRDKDLLKAVKMLKSILNYYTNNGHIFVWGNHELTYPKNIAQKIFSPHQGVLFTHGHMGVLWPLKKALKYVNESTAGCGWFKFNISVPFFQWLRERVNRKLDNTMLNAAAKSAKLHDCHTIVMGHRHPNKMKDVNHKGVRVIVLPRGRNELEL